MNHKYKALKNALRMISNIFIKILYLINQKIDLLIYIYFNFHMTILLIHLVKILKILLILMIVDLER